MIQNNKKITVLQILPSLNIGGVERGVMELANYCRGLNIATKLGDDNSDNEKPKIEIIVASSGGSLVNELLQNKVKHITLSLASKNPFLIFFNIYRIKKLIRELNVDIVHARSRAPAWSAYFACKKTSCKFITTFHGSYSNKLIFQNSKFKIWYNSIMTKGQVVIAVSAFIKNHIQNHFPKCNNKKIKLVHRGVDVDKFTIKKIPESEVANVINKLKLPGHKKIITLPGRISSWKGHEFLLKALAKVKSDDFLCIIVGSGKEKFINHINDLIGILKLDDKVRLVGKFEAMNVIYFLSDFVISASTRPEAFGRIAIEAGAMERVIVATNIGGSLETIIDEKTGFLVKNGDVEDFADKIKMLLSKDQEEINAIGKSARRRVLRSFSNKKMFESLIRIYHELG